MTGEGLREAILRDDLDTLKRELPLEPSLMDWTGEDGVPLAFLAAREGGVNMLRYLVEYGLRVNLNAVDAKGRDMLHYAAMSGSVDKCRYLVERGGMNPLRGDNGLVTPFDLAHRMGHGALEDYFAQAVGFPWEESYHNPVRRGFFPDPSLSLIHI